MNRLFTLLLAATLIASNISYAQNNTLYGKTFFNQRSEGSNLAQWIVGQTHHLHLCDTDCVNGSFFIAPRYEQTFNGKELGEFFFFNGGNTMQFGPANSAGVDVFARNFFLNDDFDGIITANPQSRNFVIDLNFYLGLDEWVRGLYFRIDVPINWTSWNMNLTQSVINVGTNIAANAFGNTAAAASPLNNIISAWNGITLDPTTFPDLKQQMLYGRIDGKQTKTSVADITFILGYNFLCNECSHAGINLYIIAPTGTRPDAQFVFEPIVGNGRHVEIGPGVSGGCELWNNGCEQTFGIYFEGFVCYMFSAKQKRTFDLASNGVGSRYLLLKRFSSPTTYAGEMIFGPNILTRTIKVRNDLHGEVVVVFDYQHGGFTLDVGYNLWGRTRDRITITDNITPNTYGVAGNTGGTGSGTANSTDSTATIAGYTIADTAPIFISTSDLDIKSAEHPGSLSHKLFTHLAYTWENCDYLPFLGVGGDVEFSGRKNRAFDQWATWVKGGFTFA